MERVRTKPVYALLAGAALGVIVMPIAFAGAAGDPQATASATVKTQLKKLKRQVNQLRQQVEDVSKQPGPQGPVGPQGAAGPPGPATGPAGGDLTGTYPNPLIGPNAVGSAQILDGEVGSADLGFGSVGAEELQSGTVGARELKGVTAVVGSGVDVNAGTSNDAAVRCPPGQMVIAGGYAWQEDEANSIIFSAPYEARPEDTWVVRGMVDAGSNRLFAWANCL